MKYRSFPLALGIALLLVASLFSYSCNKIVGNTTMSLSIDGAAIATMVLCVAIYVVCHRIDGTVRIMLHRAGLPPKIPIPIACRYVIGASIPLLLFSSSSSYTEGSITQLFEFGLSPFKLPAIALIILVVWLVALLQRLQDLSEHLHKS
jgi:hypothetical protein